MTNPFAEFVGGMIKDAAAATAEWRRKPLREQFPDASDDVLDHIIDLNGKLETAHAREEFLSHERKSLCKKLVRYDSDLTFEEVKRRKALAELQLLELKIANWKGEV